MNKEIEKAKVEFGPQGYDVNHLVNFASMIPRLQDSQLDEVLAEFHNMAGRFPYWQNSDVGSIILESLADEISPAPLSERLYREAMYRAKWCAAAATSGGEGLARSRDVNRLRNKLGEEKDMHE
jgi:hypothetical protein